MIVLTLLTTHDPPQEPGIAPIWVTATAHV